MLHLAQLLERVSAPTKNSIRHAVLELCPVFNISDARLGMLPKGPFSLSGYKLPCHTSSMAWPHTMWSHSNTWATLGALPVYCWVQWRQER